MQAWTHTRRGPPFHVLTLSEIPVPAITSPTQVLVRISHAALNPGASIIMHLLPFIFRANMSIPEMDFSGTIVKCGSEVPPPRSLHVGVEVFGSIPVGQHVSATSGALAEYVVVDHTAVVRKPDNVKMEEAAGLGIAGASALELIKHAKLKKGDSVLVNGASGGIGHLALQMAKNMVGETGEVVAVCSTSNIEWLRDLGADEVIDYTAYPSVTEHVKERFEIIRFSAIIDAVGIQGLFNSCPNFLAEGKTFVSIGPKAKSYTYSAILWTLVEMAKNFLLPRWLGGVSRKYMQVTGIANLEAMEELAQMVEQKELTVHVGVCVDMRNAKQAYEVLLSGHAQGKIVVKVQDEGS